MYFSFKNRDILLINLQPFQSKGLCNLPRLVMFTSEDSHYSVQKLASFMGIGSDNVYKIQTDSQGKLKIDHLESEIQRAKAEGGLPFLVSCTAGTTVLGKSHFMLYREF